MTDLEAAWLKSKSKKIDDTQNTDSHVDDDSDELNEEADQTNDAPKTGDSVIVCD